jgi:hypothetical protein
MIKLVKVKKAKGTGKKWTAVFKIDEDGKEELKERSFGYKNPDDPNNDYTLHNDKERRNRYIMRSKGHLKTGDPTRAGFLSMFLLWNKKSLRAGITDYNKRLKEYNETGKFPIQDLINDAVEETLKKSAKTDNEKENEKFIEKKNKENPDKFTVDL